VVLGGLYAALEPWLTKPLLMPVLMASRNADAR